MAKTMMVTGKPKPTSDGEACSVMQVAVQEAPAGGRTPVAALSQAGDDVYVISAFGAIEMRAQDKEYIADALVSLAGLIRRQVVL